MPGAFMNIRLRLYFVSDFKIAHLNSCVKTWKFWSWSFSEPSEIKQDMNNQHSSFLSALYDSDFHSVYSYSYFIYSVLPVQISIWWWQLKRNHFYSSKLDLNSKIDCQIMLWGISNQHSIFIVKDTLHFLYHFTN